MQILQDLKEPSRVPSAGGQQENQHFIRKIEDVPSRYTSYPDFEKLLIDPAHNGKIHGKIIREAMAAIEADLSGAVKGPVTRPESGYIDFYDGEGYPFDVKTPLSPSPRDRWDFDPYRNADTILSQLDKTHENKFSGKKEPVAVLLDTTYLCEQDRKNLWQQLKEKSVENPSVLNRVFEVNVEIKKTPEKTLKTAFKEGSKKRTTTPMSLKKEQPALNPAILALQQKRGR